jgi:Nif-specific regulatory protein
MSEPLEIPQSHIALLFEVGQSFTALADPEELVANVLSRTRELFNADGCSIILLDESTNEFYFPFVANDPEGGEKLRGLRFPADQGIAGWVARTGTPQHVPDVTQDPRHYGGVDVKSGVATRSLLCAPLRSRSGTLGVIEVINRRDGQSFAASDLQILAALAGSVAIALENAHLYHRLKLSEARLREQVVALERERVAGERFPEIIGHGPAIEKVFRLMESACSSPISVLIEGETGTGKELIARAIHGRSERRDQPFVAVNCGALQETLLESELFGHRKGSFTGAISDKRGLFAVANGGTIFLDEIGETVPAMQVKLLRVLQSGEFLPVGGTAPERVDVRVICATNRTLMDEVRAGRFREDLYYRLSAFPITLPPLRQRTEDIPLLVGHFLGQLNEKWKKHVRGTSEAALALLTRYHWPGNVRELENEMARALTLAGDEDVLQPHHLSTRIAGEVTATEQKPRGTLKQARAQFEREYIAAVLAGHHHNVSHSAKALGISRVALQKKMKEYRLREERPASAGRTEG